MLKFATARNSRRLSADMVLVDEPMADGTPVAVTGNLIAETYAGFVIDPHVAALNNGGYVLVWTSRGQDSGNTEGVYGRRFTANGDPLGAEFQVNVTTGGNEDAAGVVGLAGGGFAVIYRTTSADASNLTTLLVRVFNSVGDPASGEIPVGAVNMPGSGGGPPVMSSVAALPGGGFVVSYTLGTDSGDQDTYIHRFGANGSPVGGATLVHAPSTTDQFASRVIVLSDGTMVAIWQDNESTGGSQGGSIRAQRFDAFGGAIGGVLTLASLGANGVFVGPTGQAGSAVALAGGGFAITWRPDDFASGSVARIFDSSGAAVSGSFPLSPTGLQLEPDLAALADGGFVATWADSSADGGDRFARRFDATGAGVGVEFAVHPGTNKTDRFADVTELVGGNLVFVTSSFALSANSVYDIVHRVFAAPPPDLTGTAGDDNRTGTGGDDLFLLQQGGNDTASGGDGNDGFFFGGAYTGADSVDGGAGALDQVGLQGSYGAGVTLGSLTGVELLVLLPGSDTRFGDTANNFYDYNITSPDVAVAAGQRLIVQANTLRAGEDFNFNGSAETDSSFLIYGGLGNDVLTGGSGNDGFFFGQSRFGASDVVNGGAGTMDQLGLQGNFTLTFGASQMSGIEFLVLLSANDNRFGAGGGTVSYDLTMNDDNVAAGQRIIVSANTLAATETLTFRGFFESNGSFQIFSGAGNDFIAGSQTADDIWGGAGDDFIEGQGGADTVRGGAGNDIFHYLQATHSAPGARDQILDFATGDKIDLTGLSINTGGGSFSFIGGGAQGGARQVQVIQTGNAATVNVFIDGDAVADMVIDVTVIDGHSLTAADFAGPVAQQGEKSLDAGGADATFVINAGDVHLADPGAGARAYLDMGRAHYAGGPIVFDMVMSEPQFGATHDFIL